MNLPDEMKRKEVEALTFRAVPMSQATPEEAEDGPEQAQAVEDVADVIRMAEERGRQQAMTGAEAEFQKKLAEERTALLRVAQQFEQEKQRYFSDLEEEVVKLSLAIAERVLHREAEMDPTLLAGAARVALEQVHDTSETVLCVSNEDRERWHQTFAPAGKSVLVEPCDSLEKGEAVLKTRSGSVQLGVKAQLQEIERGFFELLTRRPLSATAQ